MAFRNELERRGIEAVPICELAEIVDPTWGPALEGLLGRAREALVVPPDRLTEALGVLQSGRDRFHRCILVKTTDTAKQRARRYDDGPLTVIESSDPHAEAFLGVRLGGYDLARDDAELARLARAVAPSGRTTAGMAYSVTRNVDLLMTRGHRGPTADSRRAHEVAVAEARRLRGEAAVLREAARTAAAIRARIAQRLDDVDALRGELDGLEGRRRTLQTEREGIEKRDTAGLAAEIAALTTERGRLPAGARPRSWSPSSTGMLADEAALRARLVRCARLSARRWRPGARPCGSCGAAMRRGSASRAPNPSTAP